MPNLGITANMAITREIRKMNIVGAFSLMIWPSTISLKHAVSISGVEMLI